MTEIHNTNRIRARLLVALKGADLAAGTAEIALVDKMGFGDRLAGLKRFDYFDFHIDSPAPPSNTIDTLQRILDRQSTFYNRNKHVYSLACEWDGGDRVLGLTREQVRRRWLAEISKAIAEKKVTDLHGKDSPKGGIFSHPGRYLVDVLVEDDDTQARASIAAKIRGGLAEFDETRGAEVRCEHRATVWWLAIHAPDTAAAQDTARDITVTTRRDRGLLMNPNYQRAEIVSVEPIAPETQ